MPVDKGAHTERVSELAHIPAKTSTPQKGVTPPIALQPEFESPVVSLVISTSDPFTALSQAGKDGFSLVVTPTSILNSATRGLDVDLSSEGSK